MENILSEISVARNNSSPSETIEQALIFQQRLDKLKLELVMWIFNAKGYRCVLEGLSSDVVDDNIQISMTLRFSDDQGAYACSMLMKKEDYARLSCNPSSGEVSVSFRPEQLDALFQRIKEDEIDAARKKSEIDAAWKKTAAKIHVVADID